MKSVKDILSDNLNFFIKIIIIIGMIFLTVYLMTPNLKYLNRDNQKLDSLSNRIVELTEEQKQITSSILNFENKVRVISDSIGKIKNERIIIRKVYHEKIINVVNFNDAQIDSFFTEKYSRYYTR